MITIPKEYLEDIKQIALKNRVWQISVLVAACIYITFLFVSLVNKVEASNKQFKQKQNECEVYKRQSLAFQKLANDATKELSSRDSLLLANIVSNGKNIKSIKTSTNEIFNRYDTYSNSDWASAFAGLQTSSR